MSISGYLIPFPDPGAADLMSDHLEEVFQSTGPGKILIRVSVPRARQVPAGTQTGSASDFARTKLELFQRNADDWKLIWNANTDGGEESEEVSCQVSSAGTLRCKLTNMSRTDGQFALDCTYIPRDSS